MTKNGSKETKEEIREGDEEDGEMGRRRDGGRGYGEMGGWGGKERRVITSKIRLY